MSDSQQPPRVEIIPPAEQRAQPPAKIATLEAEPITRPRPAPRTLRSMLAWVPGIPTFVALWLYLLDDDAPLKHRVSIFATMLYVIMPADLLPDWFLGFFGLVDDVAVIGGLLSFIGSNLLKPYRKQARMLLRGELDHLPD